MILDYPGGSHVRERQEDPNQRNETMEAEVRRRGIALVLTLHTEEETMSQHVSVL